LRVPERVELRVRLDVREQRQRLDLFVGTTCMGLINNTMAVAHKVMAGTKKPAS
jgi:hypothetical protein